MMERQSDALVPILKELPIEELTEMRQLWKIGIIDQ